ncbi:hypothetical protein PsorP6_003735 [Peronosclerospora sorghi]|uniref:Uncharacterized protein n=1 Tax=Peronosclerospora sorghi TaxID=230839 RepID=A0ACC0VNZ2_9STRA|nr:hypothetical protein PsorP6_003735 [Peronosclerospora sorghi]
MNERQETVVWPLGENAASDPWVNDGVTSLVQRLTRIGRNNARLHEIREQRKALKEKLDTLDDPNTDLMMGEGDNVQ